MFVTLQEAGGATVRVGVGARVRASADEVTCEVDAHVPLFAASGTATVSDPLLLGKPGAPVDLALRLRPPPDTAPGRVALGAAELAATVPTTTSEAAAVRLALRGLRMPGAAVPRDLVVDAAAADELDDALLELVLGLLQAQLGALGPTSPLRGLASILGLADDAVPDFPIADLASRGPVALADWLAAALSGAAREDWMAGLALLLGGSVAGAGTPGAAVQVTIAGAPLGGELLDEILAEIWAEHFGGAAPATVVFVAIDGPDRPAGPALLPGVDDGLPADHLLDLTTAGLPPEAFAPPMPGGAPIWAVRLGSRGLPAAGGAPGRPRPGRCGGPGGAAAPRARAAGQRGCRRDRPRRGGPRGRARSPGWPACAR